MIIYDATNAIVGRLAALTAKKALQGESTVIVNAAKAVISGDVDSTKEKYFNRRLQQNKADPDTSPKWPRRADLLLRRIIKGMLPKQTSRRKVALARVRVYIGTPKEYAGKAILFHNDASQLRCASITLEDLCKQI